MSDEPPRGLTLRAASLLALLALTLAFAAALLSAAKPAPESTPSIISAARGPALHLETAAGVALPALRPRPQPRPRRRHVRRAARRAPRVQATRVVVAPSPTPSSIATPEPVRATPDPAPPPPVATPVPRPAPTVVPKPSPTPEPSGEFDGTGLP